MMRSEIIEELARVIDPQAFDKDIFRGEFSLSNQEAAREAAERTLRFMAKKCAGIMPESYRMEFS